MNRCCCFRLLLFVGLGAVGAVVDVACFCFLGGQKKDSGCESGKVVAVHTCKQRVILRSCVLRMKDMGR